MKLDDKTYLVFGIAIVLLAVSITGVLRNICPQPSCPPNTCAETHPCEWWDVFCHPARWACDVGWEASNTACLTSHGLQNSACQFQTGMISAIVTWGGVGMLLYGIYRVIRR